MSRLLLWLTFFSGFTLPAPCLHAQLYELPLSDITGHSTLIVEGRVTGQYSFWDPPHHNIYTANTVAVSRIYKGGHSTPATLTVITRGGIVADRMEIVSESVQFAPGDEGLFCLVPAPEGIMPTPAWENYGSPHGYFQYDRAANTAAHPFHPFSNIEQLHDQVQALVREPVVIVAGKGPEPPVSTRATPVISSFSPTSVSAGTGTVLTINGSNFGATQGSGRVQFANANSASGHFDADASDVVSWSDTEITIKVPSTASNFGTAGTGTIKVRDGMGQTGTSAGTLTVDYAYTNIISSGVKYGGKLVEKNGDGGLTYTLSTSLCNSGDQDAINAVGRALRAWRCATGVNWELSTSTTSSTAIAGDEINMITWDVSDPLVGALGRATSRFWGCPSGGDFYWYVDEVDLNLDEATTWYYCDNPATIPFSSYDFQSVVFHEFGHGHQLSHLINTSAVMHRSITNGQIKRTLAAGEAAGADFIINQAANPCGPGAMTLLGSPACLSMTAPAACDDPGSCTASLPVELLAFRGAATESGIRLSWSTATERNNDYFTLERSADGITFEALARVNGAAFSQTLRTYEHFDDAPLPGLNYYRLRQTDLDGSEAMLGILAVPFEETAIRVFPNPASGDRLLVYPGPSVAGERLELTLTGLAGEQVRRQELEISGAAGQQAFSLDGVPPGVYLLSVYRPESRRLLKQELVIRQ